MATANVRFNGHSVRLNAGECDGSEALTYLVPDQPKPASWLDKVDHEALAALEASTARMLESHVKTCCMEIEPERAECCGAKPGERHPETCPRVVEWWSTRCGARPQRGQVLDLGNYFAGFQIAKGDERCTNGKTCDGCHGSDDNFERRSWTEDSPYLDCAVCGNRVEPDGMGSCAMYNAKDGGKWRAGPLCRACDKGYALGELEWRGNRLVRKGAGPAVLPQFERVDCPPVAHLTETWRKMEADDALRTRLARECTWGDRYRVATASGADLDAIAMKYGLARTPPVAPKTKDAGPTLRVYDDCGVVLAEGPVRAARTEKGARLHFAVACTTTGTASRYALTVHDVETFGGRINDGPNAMRLNTQALGSGWPIVGILDVSGLSEWQMQALGAPAKPTFDITATMEPFTDAFKRLAASAMSASESMLHAFAPAAGFCTFIANLKEYDARERREKAERRQREAALVALVNAAPAWADPGAWRVAVLAAEEAYRAGRAMPWLADAGVAPAFIACMTMLHEGVEGPPGSTATVAMVAYRRALALHKAPAPERRRGGKAVRLTVDDGRDDD